MASDVSLTTASRSQWRPNGLVKLQGYGTTEYEEGTLTHGLRYSEVDAIGGSLQVRDLP
jgi:hypothetical protein